MNRSRSLTILVFALFFLSGACGLVYEIVWSRALTQIIGNTSLAIGTILAAFMAGLALGGWILGKRGDRHGNALRLYAFLEVGIGATALIATLLMDRVGSVYVGLHGLIGDSPLVLSVIQFTVAFFLVLTPTILMGATLPILAKFVITRRETVGRGLSSLYAINTVGAVTGSFLTGFVMIGRFGIHRSVMIAVACNMVIGGVAWLCSHRYVADGDRAALAEDPLETGGPDDHSVLSPVEQRRLLWAFGLSGLASFSYEIFWTRSLVHLLGNSTYAFTMMLTAFLTGLALGSYLVRFALRRLSNGVFWFAWLQIAIGLSAVAAMPVLFSLVSSESLRSLFYRTSHQFALLTLFQFGAALVVMVVPATLIGATFPLVGKTLVRDLRRTGKDTGKVYAINTLGNVMGALAPAFLLLPVYGVQKGIALIAILNLCVGLYLLGSGVRRRAPLRAIAVAVFLLAALVLPRISLGFQFPSWRQTQWDRVLFYREGVSGTTKVMEDVNTGAKRMSIDGIIIGGTEFTDYKQQILAHFPKLLLKEYESELSIGLGSGILAGESLRHSRLRRLVCLEIEAGVVDGSALFETENHQVLADPRLELVVDDVGNYLRTHSERFDIISADEKTSDKYASNGFSYSVDYYRLLAEHLSPRGLVIQWIPTHLPPDQYRMVLRTFASSFPEVTVWFFPPVGKGGPTNTIVTGSFHRLEFDPSWMNAVLGEEHQAFQGLGKYGVRSAEALLAHFVSDRDPVLQATAGAQMNTLEYPRYEFYSPWDYASTVTQRTRVNLELISGLRQAAGIRELERRVGTTPGPRLAEAFGAEDEFLVGTRRQYESGPRTEVERHYDNALGIASWNGNLRCQILTFLWSTGGTLYLQGEFRPAAYYLGKATQVFPGIGEIQYNQGLALMQVGRQAEAISAMRRAVELDPRLLGPRRHLISLAKFPGDSEQVAGHFEAILAVLPDDLPANVGYALFLAQERRDLDGARTLLEKAIQISPGDPLVVDARARLARLGVEP